MQVNHVRANGVNFAYLEQGVGPLVILLHGFPDTAHTFSHQLPALAAAGYRAVAPWLRGYAPTAIPGDGRYDKAALAADIAALIEVLGGGKPVLLIGQDWGAIITYAVLAAYPKLVRRGIVMAVPHAAEVKKSMLDPRHVHRSFHWWFFQMADLPEAAIAANDYAFIDYLWQYWTSPGYSDPAHLAGVKDMLRQPGVLAATLGYYRAMFETDQGDVREKKMQAAMARTIAVPTLAICGGDDLRAELMTGQAQYFSGEYRFELVPGAGHFLHREKPAEVNQLILDWLEN